MKKLILLLISITIMQPAYGSDTTTTKKHKHEIGIDMTNFVKSYLNFGGQNYSGINYQPAYYLSYRYLLSESINIRSGIGLHYKQTNLNGYNSPNQLMSTQRGIDLRIGIERYYELSKRFQAYYGLDLRPGYSYYKSDANYANAGYFNGSEQESMNYSLSPILGIRFKINSRLSLFTEANYQLVLTSGWQRKFYTPQDATYPVIPSLKLSPKIFIRPLAHQQLLF